MDQQYTPSLTDTGSLLSSIGLPLLHGVTSSENPHPQPVTDLVAVCIDRLQAVISDQEGCRLFLLQRYNNAQALLDLVQAVRGQSL